MIAQQDLLGLPGDPFDLVERCSADLPEKNRWPERLAELYDVMFAYNRKLKMGDEEAARDAEARTILVAEYQGGAALYLPRGDELRRAVRDRRIYRVANRRNIEAIAREAGLTPKAVYEILKRERARQIRKLQGRLFEEDSKS